MTDQLYDEREDEKESARGETEREEEGKPYTGEPDQPDEDQLPDS